MAGLFVNVVTLGFFCLPDSLAACSKPAYLHITAPEKIEALEGSCLQVPCNYRAVDGGNANFDKTKEIVGIWTNLDSASVKITGNLTELNCTSVFSNLAQSQKEYFFRIKNDEFVATADCDGLQITVKDYPWIPTMTISGDLKENERVTITCSAVTPCPHSPPELTWNLQQDSHTQTEKNKDGTLKTKIQKIITLSDTHDGYNIRCFARYPVKGGQYFKTSWTVKTLNVSYAPKNTSASISPAGLVSAGSWVNLTCSSRANPPVSSFTWFKKREHGDMEVAEGDFYSLNVTDGAGYYCVAMNSVGSQRSNNIFLNIRGITFGSDDSLHWKIIGVIIGSIFLVVCVCTLIWLRQTKEKNPTVQQLQTQTKTETEGEDIHYGEINSSRFQIQKSAADNPARETEEEDIHYGDIDFSKQTPGPSSNSVQESRQEQDTVYSQVKVSEPANQSPQAADGPGDLYAQVKKN